MSLEAASAESSGALQRRTPGGIYVFMAIFFLGVAITGFVPRTFATLSGELPVPGFVVHVHAVLMGSWLLLFLAQTSLMAGGHRRLHQKLGVTSVALAPAIVAALLVLTFGPYGDLVAAANAASSPDLASEVVGRRAAFMLFVQGRAAVLFGLFCAWAVLARRRAPETHKRMMVMATFVVIDAALGRMGWLPGHPGNWVAADAGYDVLHLYHLLLIVPAVAYDLLKQRRVHHAYVVGVGLFLGFAFVTHVLWNATWWHAAVTTAIRTAG